MSSKMAARKVGKENAPPRAGTRAMSSEPVAADGPDPLDDDMDMEIHQSSKPRPTPAEKVSKTTKAPARSNKINTSSKPVSKDKPVTGVRAEVRVRQTSEETEQEEELRAEVKVNKNVSRPQPVKKVTAAPEDTGAEEDAHTGDLRALSVKVSELEKQLHAARATNQRLREERDNVSKRFEQLAVADGDEGDKLADRYKEKVEARAKAQSEVIATQKTLIEQLQARIVAAEHRAEAAASAATTSVAIPAPTLSAAIPDADVEKIKVAAAKEVKGAEDQIASLKKDLAARDEQLRTLQKDYEAEVRLSKEAAQKRAGSSIAAASVLNADDQAKDAELIGLYEDLTNLTIPSVRLKEGGLGKETTFVCVQTMDGKSLNFKLKTYKAWQADNKHREGGRYVNKISYEPQGLDLEQDRDFVDNLGVFGDPFEFPREHGLSFMCKLRDVMEEPGA